MQRYIKRGIIATAIVSILGCSYQQTFTQIPFKYSSLSHLKNKDYQFKIDAPLDDVISKVSFYIRDKGGIIGFRGESQYYPFPTTSDKQDKCSQARIEIAKREFSTYLQNSYNDFLSLDSMEVLKNHGFQSNCTSLENRHHQGSRFISGVIPRENKSITTSRPNSIALTNGVNTYIGTSGTNSTTHLNKIETRLEIHARSLDKNTTEVTAIFLPMSNGIASCLNGCSIGYLWWRSVTGAEEANQVMDFRYFLEDSF